MIGSAAPDIAAPAAWNLARLGSARALFAVLFALALVPVLTTPIPAMVDYVNHLARMYVLAAQGTPQASPFYHVDWRLYPNLAMDLIVPLAARWIGVETATRLFLLVSQILVVTGSLAIERQVKGRTHISGLVAILYLYNPPFAWGFLNFEAGLGVALWGIAAWLALREAPWPARLAAHAAFSTALFAAHLFALGLYGATLGLHELWRLRRSRRPLRDLAGTGVLLALPVAALAVCMLATGGTAGGGVNRWLLVGKPIWPLLMLNGDNLPIAMAGTSVLGIVVYVLAKRREIRFVASGAWIASGFAILYLVMPGRLLDTAFADIRVLVGAVLILPAFLVVEIEDVRLARCATAIVAALAILNIASVERVWQAYRPVYAEMIASFSRLPAGARVLVAQAGDTEEPPFRDLAAYPLYHAPTLAVHYADAFVPTLFTTRGKQPLVVVPRLERLSFSCGGPVPLAVLGAIAAAPGKAPPSFVADWTRDFDYVYVLGAPTDAALPPVLQPVVESGRFSLYRVRPGTLGAALSAPASP